MPESIYQCKIEIQWGMEKKSKMGFFSKYWRQHQQVFKYVIYRGNDSNEIRHFKKSAKR